MKRKESVEEYLKRGGEVKTLPYVKNWYIDYYSYKSNILLQEDGTVFSSDTSLGK